MSFACCCPCAGIAVVVAGSPWGGGGSTFTPPSGTNWTDGENEGPPPPWDISDTGPSAATIMSGSDPLETYRPRDYTSSSRYYTYTVEYVHTIDTYTCDADNGNVGFSCGPTSDVFKYKETWTWDQDDGRLTSFKQERDQNAGSYSTVYEWALDQYGDQSETGTYSSTRGVTYSGASCSVVRSPSGATVTKSETATSLSYTSTSDVGACGSESGIGIEHVETYTVSNALTAAAATTAAKTLLDEVDLDSPASEFKRPTAQSDITNSPYQITAYDLATVEDYPWEGTPATGYYKRFGVGIMRHSSEGKIAVVSFDINPDVSTISNPGLAAYSGIRDGFTTEAPVYCTGEIIAAAEGVSRIGSQWAGAHEAFAVKSRTMGIPGAWCGEHINGTTDYTFTTGPSGTTIEASVHDADTSLGPADLTYTPGAVCVQPCKSTASSCQTFWGSTLPAGCSC